MGKRPPQVGDWAHHKDGLDPREVTAVTKASNGRWYIWIMLLSKEAGPFPASNYRFTR